MRGDFLYFEIFHYFAIKKFGFGYMVHGYTLLEFLLEFIDYYIPQVVRLIASDGGSPSRTATVTLTLDYPRSLILDADDSQSAFDPSGSHSFIPDGSLSGRATNKRPANRMNTRTTDIRKLNKGTILMSKEY